MNECCCYPSVNSELYNPAEIRLYGRVREIAPDELLASTASAKKQSQEKQPILIISVLGKDKKRYGVRLIEETSTKEREKDIESVGVIYGYAFEGHCYKLPKPTIMLLPGPAQPIEPGTPDCGYSAEQGYSVWAIDKLA